MAKAQGRDDLVGKLNEVKDAVHDLYADNAARLEQFDAHLSTVVMCVEHLADESARTKEG